MVIERNGGYLKYLKLNSESYLVNVYFMLFPSFNVMPKIRLT